MCIKFFSFQIILVEKLQTSKQNSLPPLKQKTSMCTASPRQNHAIALNSSGIAYFILPSGRYFHCLFPQVGQSESAMQDVHFSLPLLHTQMKPKRTLHNYFPFPPRLQQSLSFYMCLKKHEP